MRKAITLCIAALFVLTMMAGCANTAEPVVSTESQTQDDFWFDDIEASESDTASGDDAQSEDATDNGDATTTAGNGGATTGAAPSKDGSAGNGTTAAPTKDNVTNATNKVTQAQTTAGKTEAKKTQTKTTYVQKVESGWTDKNDQYTPEELDSRYPLRKNIKGKVKAFTPFPNEDMTKKAKEMFEKSYPDADVEIISSTFAARNEKLQALIRSGDIPDYVYGATLEFPFRALKNLNMPIDEYIVPHPAQDIYLMDNCTSWKGKRYCVVTKEVGEVLWYNTALFAAKGEKTPTEYFKEGNWTWDTFASVAKRMTDTSKGVWGFSTDNDWIFPASVGQDVVRFQNQKAVFNLKNNAKYIQAYQFFLDMIHVHKSARPEHWNSYVEFGKGNIAMYYGSSSHYRQFEKAKMTTYECVPFPRRDKDSPYFAGAASMNEGFGIGYGAKNVEGGMAFGEMTVNAQLELTGNFTDKQYSKIHKMFQSVNVQTVKSWSSGMGLDQIYMQDFMGDARLGTKDLNTLINEYAPKFEAKLNDLFK